MQRTRSFTAILGLFCIFMASRATAQVNWRLGLEVTPSYFMMYNKIDWANSFNYPIKQDFFDLKGFSGGLRLSVDVTEYISLTSGLRFIYSRQDYGQATQSDAYSSYENYYTSNEMQLPLLFSIGTSNQDDVRFYGSIGFGLNYRISYTEKLSFTTKSPFDIYSVLNQYQGNQFLVQSSFEEGYETTIQIDKMYKDFSLTGLAEFGVTRMFKSGIGINASFQYQCGITNPENRDAQFYDIPEDFTPRRLWHTIDGTKWWTQQVEEDVRPHTFPMYFGVLFGVYYQFG